jgi:hypothetical protein
VKRKRIDRPIRRISSGGMDEEHDPSAKASPGKVGGSPKDDREARLAAALRANLRRRKAAPPKPQRKPDR